MKRIGLLLIGLIACATSVRAELIEFHTTNIQLLKGWDYKVGDEGRTIVTLEHYNKWLYGDFFMFVDATRYDEGGTNIFAEFSPRLSFSKMTGEDVSVGPLKDVYVAGTLEKGKNEVRAYLYGLGTDFDVPGFQVFRVDTYIRNNPEIYGKTWQVTTVWKYPFMVSGLKFLCEGFADIAGDEGPRYHPNQFIVPRLILDVGHATGHQENRLFAGVEYQYWHNKFGIRGVTESVPQLQIKWVLN